jgi:predicted transcriptional regulator
MTTVPGKVIDEEEDFELTPEQLAELDESIAEADRGEVIPAEEVLRELREMTAEYKRQHGR